MSYFMFFTPAHLLYRVFKTTRSKENQTSLYGVYVSTVVNHRYIDTLITLVCNKKLNLKQRKLRASHNVVNSPKKDSCAARLVQTCKSSFIETLACATCEFCKSFMI